MTVHAMTFGRDVIVAETDHGFEHRYSDGRVCGVVNRDDGSTFRYVDPLPCPLCDRLPLPGGEDPCLGVLPGVRNACCGHGLHPPVIKFEQLAQTTIDVAAIEGVIRSLQPKPDSLLAGWRLTLVDKLRKALGKDVQE